MGYRVRNEYGEIRFKSFTELREAYLIQMVEPEDEVLEDGSTQWRKARTLPQLVSSQQAQPSALRREGKWYMLAAALMAGGVYFVLYGWSIVSIAIAAGVFGFFLVWTTLSSFKRRR